MLFNSVVSQDGNSFEAKDEGVKEIIDKSEKKMQMMAGEFPLGDSCIAEHFINQLVDKGQSTATMLMVQSRAIRNKLSNEFKQLFLKEFRPEWGIVKVLVESNKIAVCNQERVNLLDEQVGWGVVSE